MEDVAAVLKQLVGLQKMDSAIQAMESEKSEVALRIGELQAKVQAAKTEFESKKKKLDEARKAKALIEMDIKGKEADIKKKDEQTALIKTNEAYKALMDEIGAVRREIKSLEERELVLMEEEDASHKWVKQQETAIKTEEAAASAEIKKIDAAVAEKEAAISAEKSKREAEVKTISRMWYDRYEKIRKNKGGLAMAPVLVDSKHNGICGGCRMTVRAQKVIEIKKQEEIFICESCARIIYIDSAGGGL
jgi:predicted  nucleic acid-binding Zn-ribbon protein